MNLLPLNAVRISLWTAAHRNGGLPTTCIQNFLKSLFSAVLNAPPLPVFLMVPFLGPLRIVRSAL